MSKQENGAHQYENVINMLLGVKSCSSAARDEIEYAWQVKQILKDPQ